MYKKNSTNNIDFSINNLTNESDFKKLQLKIETEEELHKLRDYINIMKGFYAPNLILKTFIKYKDNINKIIMLEYKLRDLNITSLIDRLHISTLNELLKTINSEQDLKLFYEIWNENKNKYHMIYIIHLFKERKAT
ncbi:hypothetical protein [Anaerovorax odorimutans]|uniref:hypothetical protein n=1 Tax=Anaerovorax odorimutans TaxID=109327 RepID=UPI0003FF79E0|nr:hypothetical protein [Anaerovorax odorimutans]